MEADLARRVLKWTAAALPMLRAGVLVIGRNDKGEAVGVKDASRPPPGDSEQGARHSGIMVDGEPD